jgi:hypothetical protein
LEAEKANGHAVVAERKILKEKLSAAGAGGGVLDVRVGLNGDYGGVRDGCTRLVGDGAIDAAAEGLGEQGCGSAKGEKDGGEAAECSL